MTKFRDLTEPAKVLLALAIGVPVALSAFFIIMYLVWGLVP